MTAAPVFDTRAVLLPCAVLVAFYIAFFANAWIGSGIHQGDFAVFWAAGRLAAHGHAAAAYDQAAVEAVMPFGARYEQLFEPPLFFLLLAPLGMLPYAAAALLCSAIGLAGYVASVRAILPGATATVAALAAPPVLFVLGSGQWGLFLAALLGGALALLDKRPLLAGVLIGAMAFKPHFGVLLPLFLALTGRWRVFAAATATVLAMVAISALLFGWSAYAAFGTQLLAALGAYAEQGRLAQWMPWPEVPSVYGLLRGVGLDGRSAALGQLAVAAAAAAATLWLATRRDVPELGFAGIVAAAVLVTPYSDRADWNILTIAILFLVRDGLRRGMQAWEWAVLAVVFLLPMVNLLAVPLGGTAAPHGWWVAGPVMGAAMLLLSLRRALRHRGTAAAVAQRMPQHG